jgi:hypothetical protein
MKNAEIQGAIPEEIAKAIIAAQLAMPSLRKEDTNAYGGYSYVSIDDYLAAIPKVAAQHGLFWITRETECQVIGEKGNHLAYTFVLDLGHSSGAFFPEYGRITVVHPIQGAQTAGSALAYGEKMLTRFLFKVVTGEQDADATDNSKQESLGQEQKPAKFELKPVHAPPMTRDEAVERGLIPKREPAEIIGGIAKGGVKVTEKEGLPIIGEASDEDGWGNVAAVFETFVPQCKTKEELLGFWEANIGTLDRMKSMSEGRYTKLKKLFTDTKKTLPKSA